MFFKIMPKLPPYGESALPIPPEWGRAGREGFVVEFTCSGDDKWVGNFAPGLGGVSDVLVHPDGQRAVVLSAGDLWVVDPETRKASWMLPVVDRVWLLHDGDLILSRQQIALARLGAGAQLVWHTRRFSYDGIRDTTIDGERMTGTAWSPSDEWIPFEVNLRTGRATGGSWIEEDSEGWEQLSVA